MLHGTTILFWLLYNVVWQKIQPASKFSLWGFEINPVKEMQMARTDQLMTNSNRNK